MVIVASGPASEGDMPRELANRVGSQFLVAQPGREDDAKKKRMT